MYDNQGEDYVVVLKAECGEEIEIWDDSIIRVTVFCDKCGVMHVFKAG